MDNNTVFPTDLYSILLDGQQRLHVEEKAIRAELPGNDDDDTVETDFYETSNEVRQEWEAKRKKVLAALSERIPAGVLPYVEFPAHIHHNPACRIVIPQCAPIEVYFEEPDFRHLDFRTAARTYVVDYFPYEVGWDFNESVEIRSQFSEILAYAHMAFLNRVKTDRKTRARIAAFNDAVGGLDERLTFSKDEIVEIINAVPSFSGPDAIAHHLRQISKFLDVFCAFLLEEDDEPNPNPQNPDERF